MSDKEIFVYTGSDIDVRWDGRLCIHVAECGKASGDVFKSGRDPWCVPDEASAAEVAEICERCPSGALTYTDKSGLKEKAPAENTVHVAYDGPLYLHGDIEIEGIPDDMPGTGFRAALCRCGASKNKPFCDNSHVDVSFQDSGAVGETGPGLENSGGKLHVEPRKNGPLHLSGNITLVAASGRVAWQGDDLWLCRCGHSQNKPFCDGTHKKIGFKSE